MAYSSTTSTTVTFRVWHKLWGLEKIPVYQGLECIFLKRDKVEAANLMGGLAGPVFLLLFTISDISLALSSHFKPRQQGSKATRNKVL